MSTTPILSDHQTPDFVASDEEIVNLLRRQHTMTVTQLAKSLDVTATAVRQRLTRLLAQGNIRRSTAKSGRGRPSHKYELTEKGRRTAGTNFADLAMVLWEEIRQIDNPEIRKGLLQRISSRMAESLSKGVQGGTTEERMESLAAQFVMRKVPFEVDTSHELPVLTALACPYPELAETDRTVCAMERMMFSEIVGESVKLTKCRLDGEDCCTFEARQGKVKA